ncbi:serine O-acetyltransferase [Roseobacter sp. HKCCA0434]|uniref:serine O-acetyltransferase n=1 Tax=Roseobacter sp. HKCCA0434 TaxID=3079297 RepID=UPI0029058EBF|nr:serine O-acetyltransferase [Roseobacter sp. HKCCA0434]
MQNRQEIANVSGLDPVWTRIQDEARSMVADEPRLAGLVHASVLNRRNFEDALCYRLGQKLASGEMTEGLVREILIEAHEDDPTLGQAARADAVAVLERDPACHRLIQPLMFFKGFQAVQAYRVAHRLWHRGRVDMAYFLQMRTSEVFGVDIHPGAVIGRGIMIDHAHSIVIGETARVGDNVSMLHSVTLGGTGKEDGVRHPKIGDGVLIGAGAAILGNIEVGHCSRIAAGSVVLVEVPPCKTVAGVPARIVGEAGCDQPAQSMNHLLMERSTLDE